MISTDKDTLRTFIAVKLPQNALQELHVAQQELMTHSRASVKWVPIENMHLTLKFLGNITPAQVEMVTRAVREAVRGHHSFSVSIKGAGVFPNTQRAQVIWIGLSGDVKGLNNLQRSIDIMLKPLGFPVESREFTPHLTIGRVREHVPSGGRQLLGEAVSKLSMKPGSPFIIDHVYLVKSVLSSRGPTYTDIASEPLA